mgnify:CR=1 FL=1
MTKNNFLSEQLNYIGENRNPTKLHLCTYNSKELTCYTDQDINSIIPLINDENINWLQINGMQDTGIIKNVCQFFNIDFLTTQDILNSKHLTKIEEHDDYNVVILKILRKNSEMEFEPQQLCIIHGKNYILTFVEKETDFFKDILSALNKNTLKIRNRTSDYLLSVLLNSSMANFMSILSSMEDELEDMEEALIEPYGQDVPGIDKIQIYRRNYRLIKKCILPLKENINKLSHTENELIYEVQKPFFNDVNDHLQFALQTMESCRDLITAIVDLYMSRNDQRLNDIMKQLTIVSTIFIPLTFMAGIWGMNFQVMPELSWKYGYVMAWAIMITMAVILYFFFKHKKW